MKRQDISAALMCVIAVLLQLCYNEIFIKEIVPVGKVMSINHSINVSELTSQDTVLRVLSEIQNNGTSYSLIQDGVEVAKFVPVNRGNDKVSDELTKKRLETLAKMDALSERITQHWSTDETAVEAITNDRNASDK